LKNVPEIETEGSSLTMPVEGEIKKIEGSFKYTECSSQLGTTPWHLFW
jgi:hypothetical protein